MINLRYEIIDEIENVDEITSDFYYNLISRYDKALVDSIIDNMIDEENLLKYDFYISMKLEEFEIPYVDSFELYMRDIGNQKKFSYCDNKKYTNMIFEILTELELLFYSLGYSKEICKYSIDDKVKYCLDCCFDVDVLRKLQALYDNYIDLRNKLILGNLNLVVSMAKPYFNDVNDSLEIIQNGNEGLIKAIEKYNPNMKTGFSTYAYFWIRNNIIRGLKYSNSLFRIPDYITELYTKRNKVIKKMTSDLGRVPSDEEIAKFMNISIQKVNEIKFAYGEVKSLSVMEEEEFLNDGMDCAYLVDTDFDLIEEKQNTLDFINRVKECLSSDEFFVLSKRYGLEDDVEQTYQNIGLLLGMTGAGVRVVHMRALEKVRKRYKSYPVV